MSVVGFWLVFGMLGFAFALAVQMRVMTALVLRRALLARDQDLSQADAGAAVRFAASPKVGEVHPAPTLTRARYLIDTYPRPLAHLRLARRWSVLAPVLLLALLLVRRILDGGL